MIRKISFVLILIIPIILNAQDQICGQLIGLPHATARDIALPGTGSCIFAALDNGIYIYRLQTGELEDSLIYEGIGSVRSMAVSTDSSFVVTGFDNGKVLIHNLLSNEISTVECSESMISSLDIRREANLIAAGCGSGEVIILDTTGLILNRIKDQNALITSVQLSPYGNDVAISSIKGRVCIRNTMDGKELWRYNYRKGLCLDMAVNWQERSLLVASNRMISEWIIRFDYTGLLNDRLYLNSWVSSLDYHPDKRLWTACSTDGDIIIYTSFGIYSTRIMKTTLNRIKLIADESGNVNLVVSTEKKGIRLIHSSEMEMK